MTRCVDLFTPGLEFTQIPAQQRALQHVKRVFGREPELVRCPKRCAGLRGVCFVQVRFGIGSPVEFILANGLLVAIPPKKPGLR